MLGDSKDKDYQTVLLLTKKLYSSHWSPILRF